MIKKERRAQTFVRGFVVLGLVMLMTGRDPLAAGP
jgi:hypothetical protein